MNVNLNCSDMITDINSEDLEKADTQETLPAGRLEATDKLSLDSDAGSEYTRRAWGADQRSVGVPPANVCAKAGKRDRRKPHATHRT